MRTLYDLLDVRSDADDEALRRAYHKAAKAHHPDLNADDPDAPRRFNQIAAAIGILRNPEQRAAYDRLLDRKRRQHRLRLSRIIVAYAVAAAAPIVVLVGGRALIRPISTATIVSKVENRAVPGPVAEARERRAQRTEPTEGAEREATLAREQAEHSQAAEREQQKVEREAAPERELAAPERELEERRPAAGHQRQKAEREVAQRPREEHKTRQLAAVPELARSAAPTPSQAVQGAQTASSAASPRSFGPVEIAAMRAFTRF
jgi:curved DNA-binding protein CbpA